MESSAPFFLKELTVNKSNLLSFDGTFILKDFCPKKIVKLVPELSEIIDHLIELTPKKRFITVDVKKHDFQSKTKTCTDTSFHVDGVENEYTLWSIGEYRTEFLLTPVYIHGLGSLNPSELSLSIKKSVSTLFDPKTLEAVESTPARYNSLCIHRGRIAEPGAKRILIRICSSDYLSPKNIDLSKNQKRTNGLLKL